VINTLQLATRKNLIQMSPDVITILTVIINYQLHIKICYYNMFTLEQKIFLCSVTSQMEKDLRTANGLIRHLEFLRNFNKSFRTFKALIDVPTLQRSFENMK
jgi:hypothetical protein